MEPIYNETFQNFEKVLYELLHENKTKTPKQISKSIQKPYSTLMREMNPKDRGAKVGAVTMFQIMVDTGDMTPLVWLADHFGCELRPRA